MIIELASFVLGILAVLLTGVVVGVFRANKKANENKNFTDELARQLKDDVSTIHVRIDGETQDLQRDLESLHRELDSRLDKFSNKVEKQLLKG